MEKDSTIYKYGCSEIPYQLLDMLSATAYKVFGKIYQCISTNCRDMRDGVEIPKAIFTRGVGNHRATIRKSIDELISYGIVSVQKHSLKRVVYYINWDELNLIHEKLHMLNNNERNAIFQLLHNKKIALSQLPEGDYLQICNNNNFLLYCVNTDNNIEKENKKVRYSIDEMAELFLKSYPYLIPTNHAVGRFAKRQGFTMIKQMIKGKLICFYVKKENV